MKNKFPYPGITKKVTEEMCDLNGHMNVTFYTKIFEEGSYEMFNQLGMGFDYINSGFSTFTLEQNLRYVKENLLGDKISTHYRIVNVNRKLIHHVGILLNNDKELKMYSNKNVFLSISKYRDVSSKKLKETVKIGIITNNEIRAELKNHILNLFVNILVN